MRGRALPAVGLVVAMLLTASAAAMATAGVSRERAYLDGRLRDAARSEAGALEQFFRKGREAVLVTSRSPSLREAYRRNLRGDSGTEATLSALETFYPGLQEACLIDLDGRERARVVRGAPSAVADLSPDEGDAPFFRPTVALAAGQALQSRPYISEDTGQWVVANAAPVFREDGTRAGIVHFEVSIEAFRTAAAETGAESGVDVAVVDGRNGAVLMSGTASQRAGAPLGDPGDRRFAGLLGMDERRALTLRGLRVSAEPVSAERGNTNRWLVVSSAPAVSVLAAVGPVPPALLLVAGLVLALSAIETRRARAAERRGRIEVEQRSRTDPLTGLYNRRHAVETITGELSRAAREGTTPAVLVLDIDHFKQVNDVYGHQAGDLVIREIGRRIRSSVRDYDLVARWGGEEFAVLLPGTATAADVRTAAERVRKLVAFAPVRLADRRSLSVTVSIGGAVATEAGTTAESIVEAADRALYAAKRRGRNQTVLFADMSQEDIAAEEPEAIRLAQGLALAVSVREASPDHHCEEVADLSARIAHRLGLSDSVVMRCRLGGWIHDVGKLAIPDRIISKPTALDDEEREILHSHVTLGAEIVRRIAGVRDAAKAVLHHHERWDGSGYPDGLTGHEIPIEARIVACADAFSAITAGRPYQPPLGPEEAVRQLRRSAGRSLDPVVVEALAELLAEEKPDAQDRAPATASA